MYAPDINGLFSRAEQAFVEGRLEDARSALIRLDRGAGTHPSVLHLLALVEKKLGSLMNSQTAFRRSLALSPDDPEVNNNYANLLVTMGDPESALDHFGRAVTAAPDFNEARYNRALVLQRVGKHNEALAELEELSAVLSSAKVHSARAALLREMGRLSEAAEAYETALQFEPRRAVALHGRARTALERGEPDASKYYRRALLERPADPDLQLGLSEALEAEGDPRAKDILAKAVAARPEWPEGQLALARMRWEAGEGRLFIRDLEKVLRSAPENSNLWKAYTGALAAADLFEEAADAAASGRAICDDSDLLQLSEALYSSEAGDLDRAEQLFASLPEQLPGRNLAEVRHQIRCKRFDQALLLSERTLLDDPWNVSAWAFLGLLWRVTGDERADWLHKQPNLIATQQLELTDSQIEEASDLLRTLHRTRSHPIGQSLRRGTQTRGRLFESTEPAIAILRDAIFQALKGYWAALPLADPSHPLLRNRDKAIRLDGSWSVRLTTGGFHISHIHPKGILSSACYLIVPCGGSQEEEGWLEIGRPPAGLGLDLEPLLKVEPRPGKMALFPSTIFHGTRPFSAAERLTVAFDVVTK